MARNDSRVLHDTHFQVTQWTRHTERIAPRWCRLAPHTRASACTRACTLYGCAARAPHGNDESSTLEHLASGPFSLSPSLSLPLSPPLSRTMSFSRFLADSPRVARRALALRRATAESRVPDRRTLSAVRARACERARACTHHGGRVRAKRRPRSCHDFAFVYARSLSFNRDHLRHSRASRESPRTRSRSRSRSHSRCGRVLANLRGRGDMFSFPMIYAGKWVARAWKCHAGRYRWQLSMGRSSVLLGRMRPPGELEFRVAF